MTENAAKDIFIRAAVRADSAQILNFIRELAIYEEAEHEVLADEDSIGQSLFGPESVSRALIGELNGEAIGFAVYFYNYSTWLAKNGLYLEDLYVSTEHRGSGMGKALLRRLAQIAVEQNCGRFEWSVLDWNEPAIGFYRRMGAVPQDEWTTFRLSGAQLKAVAGGEI